VRFTKMHGAGNDFIIINNMEERIPVSELSDLAKALCNRRMSIGADGFIAVDHPESSGDFKMLFYNSDGSAGEMCGNGARCIARYGYENKLSGEVQKIETAAGVVYGWRLDKRVYKVRLPDVVITKLYLNLDVFGSQFSCFYLELGDPGLPHAGIEVSGIRTIKSENLKELGFALRHHSTFEKGANINFWDLTGENELHVLTFERGVEDFTLACGSGAGATVAALTLMDKVSGENTKVCVPGGELFVTAVRSGEKITELYLSGFACMVAEGIILEKNS